MKKLPTIKELQKLNEAEEFSADAEVGVYHLYGKFQSSDNKNDDYDGHFNIALYMPGSNTNNGRGLKWDIKKPWLDDLKKVLGGLISQNNVVYGGFAQNSISYLYIKEKDSKDIWNKTVEVFKKLLAK